ncbi:GNAT family N-acetyltransferase [Arthrobacter sp. CAN_C5]|uniref:GNAT family N-acetyltransferase n=1 Tax=Arthrobacter sp. CAN_C5 TaxID=2760706 RepID=UPI001AE88CB6|nr:putative GNAT family N-acyltransferase [Arthrobacter sp. CAN_C5]
MANPQRRYWYAVEPETGELTGHASLLVDQPARMTRLGYIIVDPQRRGQSLGRELVQQSIQTGFGLTGLPSMKLHVYAQHCGPAALCQSGVRKTASASAPTSTASPVKPSKWKYAAAK